MTATSSRRHAPAEIWDHPQLAPLVERIREDLTEWAAAKRADGKNPSAEDRQARAEVICASFFEEQDRVRRRAGAVSLTPNEEHALRAAALRSAFGTPWEKHLRDEYSDIFINGPFDVFAIRRDTGDKVILPPVANSDRELVEQIRQVASHGGRTVREINEAQPTLNLRLNDGSRLHAVISPLTNRTSVSIRRHDATLTRLDDLFRVGMFDKTMYRFLRAAIAARKTLVIVGGVGAGKTTLARAILNAVDPAERIITVEDDQELGLSNWPELNPDVVEYEARPANIEGRGEFTLEMCLRETLRQNPSRVVVGEVRGGEVVAFLRAITNGLTGSLCTIHANSTAEAFDRLVLYAAFASEKLGNDMVRSLIASAVDFVIHVQNRNGRRRVSSIREVVKVGEGGRVESNELWAPKADDIRGYPTGIQPTDATTADLERHGFDRRLLRNLDGTWVR